MIGRGEVRGCVTDLSQARQHAPQGFVLVLRDIAFDVLRKVGAGSVGVQDWCEQA